MTLGAESGTNFIEQGVRVYGEVFAESIGKALTEQCVAIRGNTDPYKLAWTNTSVEPCGGAPSDLYVRFKRGDSKRKSWLKANQGAINMTSEEQRNLDLAKHYEDTYNLDIIKFIHECYTPDCVVNDGLIRGYEQFIKIEESVLRAAPKRKMRVDHRYAVGNVVIVQAVLLDPEQGPDWQLPFCAVLTCRDGKIVSDWTYAEFTKWPGSTSW
jgi:hypothetical protein